MLRFSDLCHLWSSRKMRFFTILKMALPLRRSILWLMGRWSCRNSILLKRRRRNRKWWRRRLTLFHISSTVRSSPLDSCSATSQYSGSSLSIQSMPSPLVVQLKSLWSTRRRSGRSLKSITRQKINRNSKNSSSLPSRLIKTGTLLLARGSQRCSNLPPSSLEHLLSLKDRTWRTSLSSRAEIVKWPQIEQCSCSWTMMRRMKRWNRRN